MRQPDALHLVLAAISDIRLCALIVELARNGAAAGDDGPDARPVQPHQNAAGTPPAPADDPARKRPGWPRGKPRGPRRASQDHATVLLARRAKRARLRAAKANGTSNSNGAGPNSTGTAPTAERLWRHAAKLEPAKPWRAIAREFGLNELECYRRRGDVPPGLPANAIERFLELPVVPGAHSGPR